MASQCEASCSRTASFSEPDVRRLDYSSESDFSEPEEQAQKGDRVSLSSVHRQKVLLKEHNLDRRYSREESPWFTKFEEWCQSSVGKKAPMAKTTVERTLRYLLNILFLLDSSAVNFDLLWEATSVEKLINDVADKVGGGPSGKMMKVDAIMNFFKFVIHYTSRCPREHPFGKNTQLVLQDYQDIRSGFNRERRLQTVRIQEEEEELDGMEEVITCFVNDPALRKRCIDTIEEGKNAELVLKPDQMFVMRYILAVMTYTNAQRSGAVLAITVNDVKQARKDQKKKGGLMEIKVYKHKTGVQSAAHLVVAPFLVPILRGYVKYVRPKSKCDAVFTQGDGKPIKSNFHGIHIKRLGADVELELPSATMARKIASSISAACLESKDLHDLTQFMSHSYRTANHYYRNIGARKRRHDAYGKLQENLHLDVGLTKRSKD